VSPDQTSLTYSDLLDRTDAPPGSTWGLFGSGADGDIGTVGLLDAAAVLRGAAAIRSGERFAMGYPVDAFDPPMLPSRAAPRLRITSRHREHRDDVLDHFNPQSSSQLDGLRHRRHERYGFYNWVRDEDVRTDLPRLGVQLWAELAIAGRAVLLDLEPFLAERRANPHGSGPAIEVGHLQAAVARQGVAINPGDMLVLHTGWCRWYLDELDDEGRARVRARGRYTGFAQRRTLLAWMWDRRIALVGSDTYAWEVMPPIRGSEFTSENDGGMMHQELLALLGLAIGELWRLDALVAACRLDSRWDFLLVSSPLNVPGGVSSPANATAVR
jgi:kynurenine formamidase